MAEKCSKHPRYKGIRPPKINCKECFAVRFIYQHFTESSCGASGVYCACNKDHLWDAFMTGVVAGEFII